jgi:hypothetical protein
MCRKARTLLLCHAHQGIQSRLNLLACVTHVDCSFTVREQTRARPSFKLYPLVTHCATTEKNSAEEAPGHFCERFIEDSAKQEPTGHP